MIYQKDDEICCLESDCNFIRKDGLSNSLIGTCRLQKVILLGGSIIKNENSKRNKFCLINNLKKRNDRVIRFELKYENGDIKNIKATMGSYLYRLLMSYCRNSK